MGSDKGFKIVEVNGSEKRFEVLQSFEFDSDRKRMSVIIRDNDGSIKLYIKGADAKIIERLDSVGPQPFRRKIDKDIDSFSKIGLRTLLIAMRMISEEQYADIAREVSDAADAPDREKIISTIAFLHRY